MPKKAQEQMLIGVDCGTSGIRVAAYNVKGVLLGHRRFALRTRYPHTSFAEQDARVWLARMKQGIRELVRELRPLTPSAIGVCGTTSTIVACDTQFVPRAPAIMWFDRRAAVEAAQLSLMVGETTTHRLIAEQMAPKLLWIRRYAGLPPDTLYLDCAAWLAASITGLAFVPSACVPFTYGISPSEWPSVTKFWDEAKEILCHAMLSEIDPTSAAGSVSGPAKEDMGLASDTSVVVALPGADALMSAVGAGLLKGTSAIEVGGTAYMTLVPTLKPLPNRSLGSISLQHPFYPDQWIACRVQPSAGLFYASAKRWLHFTTRELQILGASGNRVD